MRLSCKISHLHGFARKQVSQNFRISRYRLAFTRITARGVGGHPATISPAGFVQGGYLSYCGRGGPILQ